MDCSDYPKEGTLCQEEAGAASKKAEVTRQCVQDVHRAPPSRRLLLGYGRMRADRKGRKEDVSIATCPACFFLVQLD
jgi:hypothetical protein